MLSSVSGPHTPYAQSKVLSSPDQHSDQSSSLLTASSVQKAQRSVIAVSAVSGRSTGKEADTPAVVSKSGNFLLGNFSLAYVHRSHS